MEHEHDQPDYERPLGADLPVGTWVCPDCGATNSELDSECQFCEPLETEAEVDDGIQHDPAWQSEAHLRNMEGYGDYEGPVTWP